MTSLARFLSFHLPFAALAACSLPIQSLYSEPPPPFGLTVPCKVTYVVDGDTIEVEVTTKLRVRLIDCWAPELGTQEGKNARVFMDRMAIGKEGTLFVPRGRRQAGDVTTLSRVLGHVWMPPYSKSLSEMMVEMKYATKDEPPKKNEPTK